MKPSFKTTTLIAAIGMTIAAGYVIVEQFIDVILGIDLYVHPIRMQGLWRLHDSIWWASIAIFFWGLFRYPHQLPQRTKQSKVFGIISLITIALLFVMRLWIISWDDPQWVHYIRFIVRCAANIGWPIVLWWLFVKSDSRQTPNAMRYIAIITFVISIIAVLFEVCSDTAWWYNLELWVYASFYTMTPFYNALYVAAASCVLICMYGKEQWTDSVISDNKTFKSLKHTYVAGWVILGVFAMNALLLVFVISHHFAPDWLIAILAFFFFVIPVIAGIYLLKTCRLISQVLKSIESQNSNIQQS